MKTLITESNLVSLYYVSDGVYTVLDQRPGLVSVSCFTGRLQALDYMQTLIGDTNES